LASTLENGLGVDLRVDGQSVELLPEDVDVVTQPRGGYSLSEDGDVFVAINVTLTADLKGEGLAHDIVRRIQNQRKEADFNIADWIETYYVAGLELTEVFETFGDYIAAETLSASLRKAEPPEGFHVATYRIDEESLKIGLRRAKRES